MQALDIKVRVTPICLLCHESVLPKDQLFYDYRPVLIDFWPPF